MKNYCLLVLLFLGIPLLGSSVKENLKQISLNDKLLMKEFVELTIRQANAGHVIYFDNKPVCLGGTFIKSPQIRFDNILWLKGWKAFKRNEHLFAHPNFIFNTHLFEKEEGWQTLDLFIINKKALCRCVNQHLNLFQEILGSHFTYESFLAQIESGHSLSSLIHYNEMLLGILLGFGEESCRAYQEMRNKYKGGVPPWTETYCGIEIKSPNIRKIFPIGYMGNPQSLEVQKLAATYEKELEIFWNIYRKQDPLVFFLECICQ